ncbi:reverse transcriptase [Gossypium australe]|uniref:Reverse transcriptase n=1 Tax=Gossypium australe TaxID=47621 RepID=A0A5B6W6T8_9ROSI|nr:reverse transcriptase [Gossypium australe]
MFSYYRKCHKLRLTHLNFSDDLLIFSKGNLDQQFNPGKSEIFSSGILEEDLQHVCNLIGFKRGMLLVRYLEVPLITRKLIVVDYFRWIEKINHRINGWIAKHLSYPGRFQLI